MRERAAPRSLTRQTLVEAADSLAARDGQLGRIVERFGHPPLWGRRPGFSTLVRIVLEQQVSLASARATFERLRAAVGPLTPVGVTAAGETTLRAAGLTRQKTRYCLNVARAIEDGSLDLAAIARADDDDAMAGLTAITGIGPWTAECYLLMALRRPDVWPAGDIALQSAVQDVKGLRQRPSPDKLIRIAERWRPHRATAARMLWHHYLSCRQGGAA